ncbi:MAG: PaaI family thioesterase [Bacteroidota bacterium]|nr:PaaI family thioesterase [Bacteroidota bacterium]
MIDTSITLDELNARNKGNMGEVLGFEFVEINPEYLMARMPVDSRTWQPLHLLSGGASAALAETVGSMAAYLSLDRTQYYCLGLDIKCNHIRSVAEGYVYATARPVHVGRRTHVWQIEAKDVDGKLVTLTTLTMAVLEIDAEMRARYRDLFFKGDKV